MALSCKMPTDNLSPTGTSFRIEMSQFIEKISKNAKAISPKFNIITQNGIELFETENKINSAYLSAIDGQLIEGRNFGNITVNQAINTIDNAFFEKFLSPNLVNKLPILNIDFCDDDILIKQSLALNNAKGYKLFVSTDKNWDNLNALKNPLLNENANNILNLADAKNFIILPNISFSNKEIIFNSLKNTNYDIIIIDAFYQNQILTITEINALKTKKNGGKRLVLANLNLGLAYANLYYWQANWKLKLPDFVNKEIGNEGKFRVNYWDSEWQNVVTANENSIINQFIKNGFDGVNLTEIEAFKYYE